LLRGVARCRNLQQEITQLKLIARLASLRFARKEM
jgi:hypothetical protein